MRLSFDLDGVICGEHGGLLGTLHADYRTDPSPHRLMNLLRFYASRKVELDPRDFAAPEDRIFILTGRSPLAHAVTGQWVKRHFGDSVSLWLVGDEQAEELFIQGRYTDASRYLAQRKAQMLKGNGVGVHFDNNEEIVRTLRDSGIIAILVGREVSID